jgi:opacity protein-like surface antigen
MLRRNLISAVVLAIALAWPALADGAPQPEEFSSDVASRLLQQVTQGFITNNQGQVLAAFDAARMKNYTQFRDDIVTLFAKYESFRAAYRLRQSWPQGQHGVVIVEFELEGTPLNEGALPFRRSAQVRFEFERGRKGWRIVDVAPRRFFS